MPELHECIFVVRGTAATNVSGAGACIGCLAEHLDVGGGDVRPRLGFDDTTYTTPFQTRLQPAVGWLADLSAQFPGCEFQALFDGPHGLWGTGVIHIRDGAVARADYWPADEWHGDGESTVALGTAPDGAPALVSAWSGACAGPAPVDATAGWKAVVRAHTAARACAMH
jgi:hypothetical protein